MATRDPKAWRISTVMEPNFEGGLIHNDWLKGTVFIKITKAQRNVIPLLSRSMEADNTTLCFVVNDNTFYKLVNNPAGDSTVDADWEPTNQVSGGGSIIPVGQWDVSNTAPYLQDTDAIGINGQFYYVQGAPNQVDVTHTGLFQGQTTQMINNDWVTSVGTHWVVVRNTTTWESLNRPQVIIDYENGIVIAHQHEISEINNLQTILNSKFDDSNLADMVLDYVDVPDAGIANVAFLRKHFYDKTFVYTRAEIDALLSSLGVTDPDFDGNRAIRKLPVVGENTGTDKLGTTVDEMFYGFIKPEDVLQQFPVEEVGDSVTPQAVGFIDPKDAASFTGDVLIKDEAGNVGGQFTPSVPPAVSNFNQALNAKTIVSGEGQWYYLEYNYKKETGDPDTLVTGPSVYLKGVYPFLYGMAATGLTGGGIYAALSKEVVDRSTQAFIINGTNQRVYIAYPDIYGQLTSILDEAGNELIGSLFSDTPSTLAVQSVGLTINWQVDYNVYEALYDSSLSNQKMAIFFDGIEERDDTLNLDQILEGITNKHFTSTHRDKLDEITTAGSDIGDMKKSDYAPLLSIANTNGVVDKSMELVVTGYNITGAPIPAGTYLKITGIDAPNFRVYIEVADKDANDIVDAFANETIADGDTGVVIIQGYNPFIDTTGHSAGTKVYLGTAGTVLFTEPVSGSLIEVGRVLLEATSGLIQGLKYKNILSDNHQATWRANTYYPAHTAIAYTDDEGILILVRAKVDHNSGISYDPVNYDIMAGDMQKSIYDPDGDGIVENAYNQVTTALNSTGTTIVKGRLVYVSDFNSIQGFVEITIADKDVPKAANGITDEDILDGEVGRIVLTGTIAGINVPVAPLLTPLYLDTLGTFTATKPLTGLIQIVGRIIYGNASGIAYFDIGSPTNPITEDWVTGRPYIISETTIAIVDTIGDLPTEIPVIIRCKVAHTSGVFSTDWTSGYWELVSGDMVSWVYDAGQKKLDIYDMDNMDDGSSNVAMTIAERTKLAGLEDPNYKGIYSTADALRIAYSTGTDGWSASVTGTSSTWVWDSGATPNVSPPTVGGDWVDSGLGIGGDMLASVYDPTTVAGDAFLMDNFVEGISTIKLFFTQTERDKLSAFLTAANYYNKTETNNLLALKASIIYVDQQDNLRMAITTYDPLSVGGDVFDMDNMVGGTTNLILLQAERDAISSNSGTSHTHANKTTLDAITAQGSGIIISAQERTDIGLNTTDRHSHTNKALLDTLISNGTGEAFLANDGNYKETARAGIHDGTALEKQDLFVLENGGNVYVDVEKDGGGDLIVYFGSVSYVLDCTTSTGVNGRARVQIVAGTTTSAQSNNIYVYLSGGVPVLGSVTTFAAMPSEFAWIGIVSVRDAANVVVEGAMVMQRFNDSVASGDRGRISYLGERLRIIGSSWWEGVDQTVTLTPNAGALDSLQISVITGIVYQLHRQSFPVRNSATDGIYVSGVSGTGTLSNYDKLLNLNQALEYSDGSAVQDGDFFNLVTWGAINKNQTDCKLFVNPSAAGYTSAVAAYNDSDNLANFSTPDQFKTVGFLIARIPLKYTAANNGTLEYINEAGLPEWLDKRGTPITPRDDSGVGSSTLLAKIQGGLYYDSGGVTPSLEVAGEINPTTTLFGSSSNVTSPAAGRLAVGIASNIVVTVAMSVEMSANTTQARFQLHVNGSPIAGAFATVQRGNSPVIHNPTITVPLTLAANDYVSVFMTGANVDLYDLTMSIKGEA